MDVGEGVGCGAWTWIWADAANAPLQMCTHLHQDPEQLLSDPKRRERFVWERADPLFDGRHHTTVDERLLQVLSEGKTACHTEAPVQRDATSTGLLENDSDKHRVGDPIRAGDLQTSATGAS